MLAVLIVALPPLWLLFPMWWHPWIDHLIWHLWQALFCRHHHFEHHVECEMRDRSQTTWLQAWGVVLSRAATTLWSIETKQFNQFNLFSSRDNHCRHREHGEHASVSDHLCPNVKLGWCAVSIDLLFLLLPSPPFFSFCFFHCYRQSDCAMELTCVLESRD